MSGDTCDCPGVDGGLNDVQPLAGHREQPMLVFPGDRQFPSGTLSQSPPSCHHSSQKSQTAFLIQNEGLANIPRPVLKCRGPMSEEEGFKSQTTHICAV